MSLFSQAGLDAIEEAIGGGFLEVEYDGKKIRYRTLDELLRVRNMIRAKLGETSAAPARVQFIYGRDSRQVEGA
ncbi:MAG: hypothetical protein CL844_05150 [Crocinitomicaceae bacterium]|nr:hypothetical protein [Crocinitomicaceae bacterium]|tara:strand:- start:28274 stop:28495 length:222 start_codon:yes stop_codon:yes gene_type:complete